MIVRKQMASRGLLVAVTTVAIASLPISLCADQAQKRSGASHRTDSSRGLGKIGEAVAKAVLEKDIPTLLAYDRPDLRGADEVSLRNAKSDLYCYLFDSECITWGGGDWRSVYDKLSEAHPLEIKVSLNRSRADGQLYGNLLFYDGSGPSEKDLRSPDFLCKEGPARFASWRFRLENGKWRAVTPLFDSETDAFCAR
jgi:hypothetical protein